MKIVNEKFSKLINKQNLWIYILFFCLFLYLLSGFNIDYKIYDEGIAVYGAQRVADGDLPYLDFWTIYPPGQYYLLFIIFELFGFEIINARIFSIFIFFITSIILFKICENIIKSKIAIIAPIIYVFFISYSTMYATAMGTAILVAVSSIYFFHKWLTSQKTKYLFISGVFSGLVTIFRLDIGIYSILGSLTVLILNLFLIKPETKTGLKNFLVIIIGFSIFFVSVYTIFFILCGFDNVFEQLILFPSQIFPIYRALPFPNPFEFLSDDSKQITLASKVNIFWNGIVFYIPLLIYLATILINLLRREEKISKYEMLKTLNISVTGLLFYLQASIRSDLEHLLPTLFISSILFTYLIKKFGKKIIIKISFAVFIIFLLSVPIVKKIEMNSQNLVMLKIQKANKIMINPVRAFELNILSYYIEENIDSKEKIFIGNSRHDLIYINDVMLYFILNRKSGTKYHELSPGQITTEKVQLEVIRELQQNNVNFIILRKQSEDVKEKNLSSTSSGVTILDDFLSVNFEIVFSTPNYTIEKRKNIENE